MIGVAARKFLQMRCDVFMSTGWFRTASLSGLLLFLNACSLFQHEHLIEPEVAIAALRLGPGEGLYQTVFVDLMISNPNKTALKLDAITYRVRLQGRDLVRGTSREPLFVDAGGNAKYTVPATVNLLSGMGFIKDLLRSPRDSIRYDVEATLEPSGIFSMPLTVKKSDSISLTQ
jgi:LEA14-like dessication related protein